MFRAPSQHVLRCNLLLRVKAISGRAVCRSRCEGHRRRSAAVAGTAAADSQLHGSKGHWSGGSLWRVGAVADGAVRSCREGHLSSTPVVAAAAAANPELNGCRRSCAGWCLNITTLSFSFAAGILFRPQASLQRLDHGIRGFIGTERHGRD